VHVHGGRVGLEDAVADPVLEGVGRTLVIGARPDQADDVVRRERSITFEICLGDDVVRRRDERAEVAGAREMVSNSRERPEISRRSLL
jgi:hypothetical protein